MKCFFSGVVNVLAVLFLTTSGFAALEATETSWDGSEPPPGVYFHWYEPSFYTGFAPRTQDPDRVHIELGRGNQVRVTIVLGPQELDAYINDLRARLAIYKELVDAKVIELSTNREYEKFVERLGMHGVTAAVAEVGGDEPRKRAVEVMAALNPERVFRIRIPEERLASEWHKELVKLDAGAATAKLDAVNSVLPGRVNRTELTESMSAEVVRLAALAKTASADAPEFRAGLASFVALATDGRYRVENGFVSAVEFTAIYPAGTADATTTYKGERLPDFGVTGIWPLIRRDQGRGRVGMVDYLSTNPGYGFIPILAYQHASGIAYNAFHNAGVRCAVGSTPFLPKQWRSATSDRDGKSMQNLWIVGRGPTSHGCTRLASGHMSELRHVVPSDSDVMTRVRTFRNLPQCHDVFDLTGDGQAEVVGVQYYLSYKSDDHTPVRASVSNRREPFYRWLYGANIELAPVGSAKLKEVPVCRFVGRKAQEANVLRDVVLHEATFTTESIQFYKLKPTSFESKAGFEFNRELRKVGQGHTTNRKALYLKQTLPTR